MKVVTTLGIDLAKMVFQLHGVDAQGKAVLKKKVSRAQLGEIVANMPACTIAMEACATAHYWGRRFQDMGHQVKLISPQFVKPFVKSNKNDANDAEAIVEAALRPSMRFVALKTTEQQDILAIHRVRERLVGARTALVNEMRGLLGEYGIVLPQGIHKFRKGLLEVLGRDEKLSPTMLRLVERLRSELGELDDRVADIESEITAHTKSDPTVKRLMSIPGVGPLTASAMVASIGNARLFQSGRALSAWLGLVPKQSSSGGKEKLGGISKRGDKYLRRMLIHGARAVLTRTPKESQSEWLMKLRERRGFNRACVALANKNARVIWVLMTRNESYVVRKGA